MNYELDIRADNLASTRRFSSSNWLLSTGLAESISLNI